jgi:hypothetical protein
MNNDLPGLNTTSGTLEERVRRFRRDCVETMVWNAFEHMDTTQDRVATVAEVAAWYIVRLSWFSGDINEVWSDLQYVTAHVADECSYLSPYQQGFYGTWSFDQLRTEAIDILRSMEVPA